jgi:hypothetical protein
VLKASLGERIGLLRQLGLQSLHIARISDLPDQPGSHFRMARILVREPVTNRFDRLLVARPMQRSGGHHLQFEALILNQPPPKGLLMARLLDLKQALSGMNMPIVIGTLQNGQHRGHTGCVSGASQFPGQSAASLVIGLGRQS